ncbi:MAG: DNA polymerase Y family protein [Sphingomicrobium sp.]
MTSRRILSLWLPRLAIERWAKTAEQPDAPVALIDEAAHGPVIGAVNKAAAAGGARRGMRLTDARALDPALQAVAADRAGDTVLLARLARWASRWSPLVEIDGDDGLRLDISGVAHLFGGEAGLVRDIEARIGALGLTVRTAVAATAGAAWGLARFPSPRSASPSRPLPQRREGLADMLAPLPVAALRLAAGPTRTLERLGLKTIGALAGVPRGSLARRFREADNPLDALDRMLGRKPEPLTAAPFEAPPRALLRLAEPIAEPTAAGQALALLVPRLVRLLEEQRLGVRRLVLAGYRVDGKVAAAAAACALASRDPAHLVRLLNDKAEGLDPGFGFDGFVLEASWCEPLGGRQESLVDEPDGSVEVARLIDRLTVRLGADTVRRPAAHASHVPERASGWAGGDVAPLSLRRCAAPPSPARGEGLEKRPQRLLDRPEAIGVIYATTEGFPRRFVWRRRVHDVAKAEGPERIAPEWWREPGLARLRDYYRVEDKEGRRYWIFRQGLFGDGRGGEPQWFIHGLFG